MPKIIAHSKSDMVDMISHIEVDLDESLLKRAKELNKAVKDVEASYISDFMHVDAYDGEEEVRVDCTMLVVGLDAFHFEGNYNDSAEEWYTDEISLDGSTYNKYLSIDESEE